jgi:hypothetical protein
MVQSHAKRPLSKALLPREKCRVVDAWNPAFPTDQVRGLKAHGKTIRLQVLFVAGKRGSEYV